LLFLCEKGKVVDKIEVGGVGGGEGG